MFRFGLLICIPTLNAPCAACFALFVCYNRNGTVWSAYLVGCFVISDVSWIVICSWYLASQKLAYGPFFCAKLLQGLLTSYISVHAWTGQNLEICTDRVNIIACASEMNGLLPVVHYCDIVRCSNGLKVEWSLAPSQWCLMLKRCLKVGWSLAIHHSDVWCSKGLKVEWWCGENGLE
jgi:hypothetical protein